MRALDEAWPEGIFDGLTLPCGVCGCSPNLDYHVDDDFWRITVPDHLRLGVVCLECLDTLSIQRGTDLPPHLEFAQWIGQGYTIVFTPSRIVKWPQVTREKAEL